MGCVELGCDMLGCDELGCDDIGCDELECDKSDEIWALGGAFLGLWYLGAAHDRECYVPSSGSLVW